ncbi:hypothetical protein ATO10_07967 [Actibacterium atlanticum]|uniref:Gamma-butyrobetaine hydroxylase-like N-terminal domain-containing protein n=1 Tax=Actibacterium atlanticum TaxID=1461693 RepID=A0A058ZM66_9RHOB|nr:DUF971 domain-containing protein [Actibacterium atlanticum]KCV82310.1 hypothetical protein ATO10_07967 [Actibacterium atlanticum]
MIEEMTASEDARHLHVSWDNGETTVLPASLLRKEARDAWSVRERLDHGGVTVQPGICITGLYPVGTFGVNVHFSDGHDRAVYPFPYLRELSDQLDN